MIGDSIPGSSSLYVEVCMGYVVPPAGSRSPVGHLQRKLASFDAKQLYSERPLDVRAPDPMSKAYCLFNSTYSFTSSAADFGALS